MNGGDDNDDRQHLYGPRDAAYPMAPAIPTAPRAWQGWPNNTNVLGFLRGLFLLSGARVLMNVVMVGLLVFITIRIVSGDIDVTASAAAAATTADKAEPSVAANGGALCAGGNRLACELWSARQSEYRCRRPAGASLDTLTSSEAWVLLGDEFAAGSPASGGGAWWSELMSRASTTAPDPISVYNEAGPGIGAVANLTLQVAALRRDRSAAPMLASTSTARIVVFVSLGRTADSDVLPDALPNMLDSLWGGADALVNARTASRISVVLVVPPDPYWGDVAPQAAYKHDVAETCAEDAGTRWQRKERRQKTADLLALAAERNDATLVVLDHALGRFSLAGNSASPAFDARCDARDSTPHYGRRGQYAAADVVWQCMAAPYGAYTIPEMLSA